MAATSFVPNLSDGPCLYCGRTSSNKPEELLWCDLCRRPAHLACLGSDSPDGTLLADNFFTLVCQTCGGMESNATARAKMTTVQVLLLTLYNLHASETHSSRSGFYHWKIHIYNFINYHWKEIYGPESRRKKKKAVQASLSGQLSHYSQYFTSGHTTLGEGGWYRLANSLSPASLIARHRQGRRPQAKHPTASIKVEPKPLPSEEEEKEKEGKKEEEEGRRGSWFTEMDFLKPEMRPPLELFDSGGEEEGGGAEVRVKQEITVKDEEIETATEETDLDGEMIVVDGLGAETNQTPLQSVSDPLALCNKPSLFNKSNPASAQSTFPQPIPKDSATQDRNLRHLSYYEERELLKRLDRGPLSPRLHRLKRKLALRHLPPDGRPQELPIKPQDPL